VESTPAGPDWAALYLRHRDAMHRTAASILRGAGRTDLALDAVQEAMTSLMASPPAAAENWSGRGPAGR
jgi:DNA-directed RNA polymerase specialized sigma24 family protein